MYTHEAGWILYQYCKWHAYLNNLFYNTLMTYNMEVPAYTCPLTSDMYTGVPNGPSP